MIGARATLRVALAVVLIAMSPTPGSTAPARDERADLHGPLSDFWDRVRRDWAKRLPGINYGPLQTCIWVAMVWDGTDDEGVERLSKQLQEREAKRWVRSQITRHRYRELTARDLERMQAFRQNIILLGAPQDNPLVARALEPTPVRVEPGQITVGQRRMKGEGLTLLALAPNPIHPRYYALVITGSSPRAVLRAGDFPYGETDYVVYRGSKVIERGYFQWDHGVPRGKTVAATQSFDDHFNWQSRESASFRLHFDPSAMSAADVIRFGQRADAELSEAAAFLGVGKRGAEKNDLYLYVSVDEKASQTADARPAHLDPASGALHIVRSPGADGLDGWDVSLPARLLLRAARDVWGESGERELPGLATALSLACSGRFETIPLEAWAARSERDTAYLPMDTLFARAPSDSGTADLSMLDAAAFVRDLILREGAGRVAEFYRTSRRADFRGRFKDLFGITIHQAERRWLEAVRGSPTAARERARREADREAERETTVATDDPTAPARDALLRRDNAEAERLLTRLEPGPESLTLLARVYFRTGRFRQAAETAESALEIAGGSLESRAWARLTLGRARAMMGLHVAAAADLRSIEVTDGPEPARVIADLWLEHLGQSLNQRATQRLLMQEASADLMNFDWEAAESKLRQVLTSDPLNREAHAALGRVYLSKYQYWFDWILLDNELFPGTSMGDPETFRYLADKGRQELRMAESLPFGQRERWMAETGPVEPGEEHPMTHLLIAKTLLIQGDHEAARREVQRALDLKPDNAVLLAYCHLYMARIRAAAGDPSGARAEYERVLAMRVTGDVTALARQELGELRGSGTPETSR